MSKDVVERLLRYRAVLIRLKALGFVRVFSDNLADALGVSASLVRKDLATHGIRGVRRGGYTIDSLVERLTEVLGVGGVLRAVVVGCGHIGTALICTYGGKRQGVSVVAGFDVDPAVIEEGSIVPIIDVHELKPFVAEHNINVAILCVPAEAAASAMEMIREAGIRGVLDFTTAHLRSDEQCLVQTLDIRMEVERLFSLVDMTTRAANSAAALENDDDD